MEEAALLDELYTPDVPLVPLPPVVQPSTSTYPGNAPIESNPAADQISDQITGVPLTPLGNSAAPSNIPGVQPLNEGPKGFLWVAAAGILAYLFLAK